MFSVCLFLFFSSTNPTASLIQRVAESGRVLEIATPLSERVSPSPEIPPGAPPLLTFRLLEGQTKLRYGNLDLVMDDAGH